jgi:hypothetical protein
MATSVAIRQDRDAGAVKRLMTGKTLAPAAAGSAGPTAGAAAQKRAAVPFTCYRCGQLLTGSLADSAHPCLKGIERAEEQPSASGHHDLEGTLVHKRLAADPSTKAHQVGMAVNPDMVAATPSVGPRTSREASRDPRPVEQARSDLLKRVLPSSADNEPSKRQRLSAESDSGHEMGSHEDRPPPSAAAPATEMGSHEDWPPPSAAAPATEMPAPLARTLQSERDGGVRSKLDETNVEESAAATEPAVPVAVEGPAADAVAKNHEIEAADEACEETKEQELALEHDQGRGDEEPAFIEVEDEPPAAVAAAGSRRRSSRGSTQAATKAAASLAYQERHKAKIVKAIQRRDKLHKSTHARAATQAAAAAAVESLPAPNATNHAANGPSATGGSTAKRQQRSGRAQYEVETVRARRHNQHGELEYLVLWKGYPESDATWEPAANLADLEADLFSSHLDDAVDEETATTGGDASAGAGRAPPVRGTGAVIGGCQRCGCVECGGRRPISKEEAERQRRRQLQQLQDEPTQDADAASEGGGYTGSHSWPSNLLGPKPRPPYHAGVAATAASAVAQRFHQSSSSAQSIAAAVPTAAITHDTAATAGSGGGDATTATLGNSQALPMDELPAAVAQSLGGLGPCEHLERGKLPSSW